MEAGHGSPQVYHKTLFFRLQVSFSLPNFYCWPKPGPSFFMVYSWILKNDFFLSHTLNFRAPFWGVQLLCEHTWDFQTKLNSKKSFTISFSCRSLSTLADMKNHYLSGQARKAQRCFSFIQKSRKRESLGGRRDSSFSALVSTPKLDPLSSGQKYVHISDYVQRCEARNQRSAPATSHRVPGTGYFIS